MTNFSRSTQFRSVMWTLLGMALALVPALAAQETAEPDLIKDARALTAADHRLSGTPEYQAAADYVVQRLREIFSAAPKTEEEREPEVLEHYFPSVQTQPGRCEIVLENGRTLDLLPLRPNGQMAPVTPVAGISAPIIYAGNGGAAGFGSEDPAGKIVVLDYNSGMGWYRAFRMGARAVIIAGGAKADGSKRAWNQFHTQARANIPRFYYNGDPRDLMASTGGVIHSEVPWQTTRGRNILAMIPGTSPEFYLGEPEVMLLAAPLDTYGSVPRDSPGARNALNAAGLLRIAESFAQNPPKRDTLLVFYDNTARGLAGAAAFYKIFAEKKKDARLEARRQSLDHELEFVRLVNQALAEDRPLEVDSPVEKHLFLMVRGLTDDHAANLTYEQSIRRLEVRKEEKKAQPDPEKIARLEGEIAELQEEKTGWNELRRALGGDQPLDAVREQLNLVLEELREVMKGYTSLMDLKEQSLRSDEAVAALLGERIIVFHAQMALGDSSPHWGIVVGGNSSLRSQEDEPGLYSRLLAGFTEVARGLRDDPPQQGSGAIENFVIDTVNGNINPSQAFWAAPALVHTGEIAGARGIYNFVFATSQEALELEGTPDDRLEFLDPSVIAGQVREISAFVRAAGDSDQISIHRVIKPNGQWQEPRFSDSYRTFGKRIKVRSRGKALAEDSLPGAIVLSGVRENPTRINGQFSYSPQDFYAFDDFLLNQTDYNGAFGYGPEIEHGWKRFHSTAVLFDEAGRLLYASDSASYSSTKDVIRMFPAEGGFMVLPPQLLPDRALVYSASGNSKLENKRSYHQTFDGVVYWFADESVERVKSFGANALIALNVQEIEDGDEALQQIGEGFLLNRDWEPIPSSLQSASDLSQVDEARMALLRKRGISNSSLEEIHGRSTDLLEEAIDLEQSARGEALAASSYLKGKKVYASTVQSVKDLVTAVLILLILAVPFSFAMERLIIGATNIYRQVVGFAGFFAASFLALFFTHPAFAISATPMVIFLGFTILLLSSLVIFIIMQKFEVELKAMQGLSSTVHSADVSRFSTILAAMNMGISTMRRRPLRTALTAFTILLLTFTILSFASFGQQVGIVRLYNLPAPAYSGTFFHRINWKELDLPLLDLVRNRWLGTEATVTERWWKTPETLDKNEPPINQGYTVSNAKRDTVVVLRGLLGLQADELLFRPEIRNLLGRPPPENFAKMLWLTEQSAKRIGAEPGDTVSLAGRELTLGEYLSPQRMINTLDMDGSSILPVDLSSYDPNAEQDTGSSEESTQSDQSWSYLPVDSIAIAPAEIVRRAGGSLRGLTIYTPDVAAAQDVADDLSTMVAMPVSATGRDGVYWHIFGSVLQASGAQDLLFPIILGGLVIFGTMLGSVADREKEIYTFSALGLAPTHVASLFFAEALVFSVIGGFGGYMLAQVVMKVLEFFATFGWVVVPEMNHSSTNAIVTILIVMMTVLISAIYPAIKASRSANPGVMRSWRMPHPQDDKVEMTFPFTVSEYDFTGVVSFLKEHFDNFQDTSLGVFMARETRIIEVYDEEAGKERIGIRSKIALAPFDLGVTQDFTLTSTPSEIEGIDEVKILLTRLSGQPKDWERLNKNLLNDLRKQFLIWRSLPGETMEVYRRQTLETMAGDNDHAPNSNVETMTNV